MTSATNPLAPQVAYDVAMRRLEEQMRQIDAIDNKIGLIIGAASAVIAIFAGFAATTIENDRSVSLAVGGVFIALAIVSYLPAIGLGLLAYRFEKWDLRPNWSYLLEYARGYSEDSMRFWVAEGCVLSLDENSKTLQRKLDRAGWAAVFLATEATVSALGLLAIVLANGLS